MKTFLLIILTGLVANSLHAQVLFTTIDSKLTTTKSNGATNLICSGPAIVVNFRLKEEATPVQQNNLVKIGSQVIQVTPLKFSGYKNGGANLTIDDQRQLLDTYSKYELDYLKNDLKTEIINASNQWVITKLKGWFIWYFKVGNLPVKVDNKIQIQLFASTVIADKILTINAPVFSDGDFTKAGLIVNEMMETLSVAQQ